MPRVPNVGKIAQALEWDIGNTRQYAGELLEDVNDHDVAAALWAMNVGDVELAKEFLQLAADAEEAGELTPELNERRGELHERLKEAEEGLEDSD